MRSRDVAYLSVGIAFVMATLTMMQPYRLALSSSMPSSCLDAPRACESSSSIRPPSHGPLAALAMTFVVLAGTITILAANTYKTAGHIEIAPNAVHHPKRPSEKPKPPPVRTARAPRPAANISVPHPWLTGGHDPDKLLMRANDMEKSGLDITVMTVPLSNSLSQWPDRFDFWPTGSVPVTGTSHEVEAIELRGIPTDSPLRAAGLANGDVLLGIDGYQFRDDSFPDIDVLAIRKRGWMVVEIARGTHRVALAIKWYAPSTSRHPSGERQV